MSTSGIWSVLERLDPPLWLLTSAAGADQGGLIATFVTPASIVRAAPRMLVGLAMHHYTWRLVERSGAFALHLLGDEHLDWVWRFGLHSGWQKPKLDGLRTSRGISGSPILESSLGWIDCRVETQMATGDRSVYLAAVLDGHLASRGTPLSYAGLTRLASRERSDELTRQYERDSGIDHEAIRAWRRRP